MSLKLKSDICSSHVKILCFPILRGKKLLQEMVGGGELVPPLVSPFPYDPEQCNRPHEKVF